MRTFRSRVTDATFDLNLAPILDIIIAVVPLLLLSVVFVEIKMIETPVPQVVAEASQNQPEEKKVNLYLKVSKEEGFRFDIMNNGKKSEVRIGLKNGELDFDGLYTATVRLKESYPQVFNLELMPNQNVSFNNLVKVMDSVRQQQGPNVRKVAFVDATNGQRIETDLLFPNVTFGNVVGE